MRHSWGIRGTQPVLRTGDLCCCLWQYTNLCFILLILFFLLNVDFVYIFDSYCTVLTEALEHSCLKILLHYLRKNMNEERLCNMFD